MGVLVLGIDGLGYEGLSLLVRHGYFSSVFSFVKNYSVAENITTIFPPQTIPVWPSIFTGVNPGKHGVFSFFSSRRGRINTSFDVKFPYVHDILMLHNRYILVDGVPLSYPPLLVRGVYISDWLSPKNAKIINHPKANIIRDILANYIFINPSLKKLGWRHFARKLYKTIRLRRYVLEGLLENDFFDDAFIVISELDWIFHAFYSSLFRGIPKFLKPVIAELDKLTHSIIKYSKRKYSHTFLVADHGFRTYTQMVFVNEILRKLGFAEGIRLRRVSTKTKVKHVLLRKTPPDIILQRLLYFLYRLRLPLIAPKHFYRLLMKSNIRVLPATTSKAFALLNIPALYIAINKKVKEKSLLIRKLVSKLNRIRINGEPIFSIVEPRNKLFWGPYEKEAPHIGIFGNVNAGIFLSPLLVGTLIMDKKTNYHDFNPIFAIKSEGGIKKNFTANILDLAPTLYAVLSIPAPIGLDGNNLSYSPLKTKHYKRWSHLRKIRSRAKHKLIYN